MACHHNAASCIIWNLCTTLHYCSDGTAPLHSTIALYQHSVSLPHVALLSHRFTALPRTRACAWPSPSHCTAATVICPLWGLGLSLYYHRSVRWWSFPGFSWQPHLSDIFVWNVLTACTSAPPCTLCRGSILTLQLGATLVRFGTGPGFYGQHLCTVPSAASVHCTALLPQA